MGASGELICPDSYRPVTPYEISKARIADEKRRRKKNRKRK